MGRFDKDSGTDRHNCTRIDEAAATEPLVGSWNFERLMTVISGACAALTIIICLSLVVLHLLNQRNVREQKLIIRVIWLPLTWSIFSFAAVADYNAALYLDPIPLLLEAISVAAMFELFITMLVPERREREAFFANADLLNRKKVKVSDEGSLKWFRNIYVRVYQFPVVFILMTVLSEGLAVADCPSNRTYKIVDILVQVTSGASTAFAVLALLRFVGRFRSELKAGRAIPKFAMLKGVVGLTTTQKFILGIVDKFNVIKASPTASYYDWTVGFPDMLINVEVLIAALGFIWAYSWLPYTKKRTAFISQPSSAIDQRSVSTFRFLLEGIYFPELFVGIWQALKYLGNSRSRTREELSQQPGAWQAEQPYRGRKQRGNSYSRLIDEHSPAAGTYQMDLSPSRSGYGGYTDQDHSASALQHEAIHGPPLSMNAQAQGQGWSGYAPLTMPSQAQPPAHMPQAMDPPAYSSGDPSLYDDHGQHRGH